MLRVLYFGMTGVFSRPPLEKLLAAEVEVCGVMLPASGTKLQQLLPPAPVVTDLPLINPHATRTVAHVAWEHNIPVWEIGNLSDPQAMALLTELQPDVIVVACFNRIFPPDLLRLPRYGCLNLHPSLLPAYRGPAPLFWLAYHGEIEAGVTLHFLDEGIDSGDIVDRAPFAWPDAVTAAQLDQRCAALGGDLLTAALTRLGRTGKLPRLPQSEEKASYFPWPQTDDFRVSTGWDARRAFNFLRFAAGTWPVWVEADHRQVFIRVAIDYDLARTLSEPLIRQGDEMWIQFSPGVVRVKPEVVFGD